VIVRLPGEQHGTDYQQQSGHLTLCWISSTNWKLTFSDGQFLFLFHSSRAWTLGALELDSRYSA